MARRRRIVSSRITPRHHHHHLLLHVTVLLFEVYSNRARISSRPSWSLAWCMSKRNCLWYEYMYRSEICNRCCCLFLVSHTFCLLVLHRSSISKRMHSQTRNKLLRMSRRRRRKNNKNPNQQTLITSGWKKHRPF
jgi:hypothetical protein